MSTMLRLVRGEIRKLTTTKLLWGFLAVLVVIAGLDAAILGATAKWVFALRMNAADKPAPKST